VVSAFYRERNAYQNFWCAVDASAIRMVPPDAGIVVVSMVLRAGRGGKPIA